MASNVLYQPKGRFDAEAHHKTDPDLADQVWNLLNAEEITDDLAAWA